ncbi:MAG: Eco57I restriction-modification methylase domain-containing protein [Acidobacteria bacterium]|nr:Eco57I restriction-modification methylase domain-containing protein [Acidobacteriota bacterium]
MIPQASFALKGRNPDVLTCIANLSNDEVFTPPELANRMLDTLTDAWAADNGGADIWADSTVKFLDPCTKSGVFLREITARLTNGLAEKIPDLQERVNHIVGTQVFGIAITHLTSLLARRSVYCSKHAQGKHSIAKGLASDSGNIWFERLEHTWSGTKCRYCGAPKVIFDRAAGFETHAYPFIHTDDVKARLADLFGGVMQFDVVIGNPPYQMTGAAGGSSDASIYHLFVEQAQSLDPRYLSMIIPSRWLAGGRGLDEFRASMLGGGQLMTLADFPASREVFPGVEIKGGVCYFLWSKDHSGTCDVTITRGGKESHAARDLGEFDVFIRDPLSVAILHKVLSKDETSITSILSRDTPFGIASNYSAIQEIKGHGDIPVYFIQKMKRGVGYVSRSAIEKNTDLIDTWKVLVPEAYNGGDAVPHQILGKPQLAPSPSVCTQSFLFLRLDSELAAQSAQSYYSTRFFRFLVSLRKITQHALHSTYTWVPLQAWDRIWTDGELYMKYGITSEEQTHIESEVRPMKLDDSDDE